MLVGRRCFLNRPLRFIRWHPAIREDSVGLREQVGSLKTITLGYLKSGRKGKKKARGHDKKEGSEVFLLLSQ